MKKLTFSKFAVNILSTLVLLQGSIAFAQSPGKALSTADVLTMIKAGLPESTIVLSIQQSPSRFDTSPQALINLKNQGVSQNILNAMLKDKAAPVASLISTAATAQQSAVKMIVGNREIFMRRSKAQDRSSNGLLGSLTPFGRFKKRAVLDGSQARLKISGAPLVFEASLPPDVSPDEYMVLLKMSPKKNRREVVTESAGFSGEIGEGFSNYKAGFEPKAIMPLNFKVVKPVDAAGNIVYRATLDASLSSGEYALFYQENYYDFSFSNNVATAQ
ncbi:MAG: hypothetical protein ACFCU8_15910 [Thermosynechococcaceae cyanobacterium]